MDIVDTTKRSKMMAGVRSKDTRPELQVRKFLHSQGFRYRLHAKELPGSPDLVLPKYNVVIFVHGCFWHRHDSCTYATTPATNVDKWLEKFSQNINRDKKNVDTLKMLGWRVITVWECALRKAPVDTLERLSVEIVRMKMMT